MAKHLVTHSGAFHADEMCAYTILKDLNPDADLTRTRDKSVIEDLVQKDSIVFDIGDVYDPSQNRFDHHQPGADTREDGTTLSSFGLVWRHFGKEWLGKVAGVPENLIDDTHKTFDEKMVKYVDLVDNGQMSPEQNIDMSIPGMIFRSNPQALNLDGTFSQISPEEEMTAFKRTQALVRPMIMDQAQEAARTALTKGLVKESLENRDTPEILTLDKPLPWRDVISSLDSEDVRLVVSPTASGTEWITSTVPQEEGSFTPKRKLPQDWAGKRNEDLQAVTGNKDMHFVHAGQWMAAGTSKEGALALAHQANDIWREEDKIENRRAFLAQRAQEEVGKPKPAPTRKKDQR